MAHRRVSMRKTKEILRLKYDSRLSNTQISKSCRVSPSTVWDCLKRFKNAQLPWPLPEAMDDQALEKLLYQGPKGKGPFDRCVPDWTEVKKEMHKKHVTLALLWHEYKEAHPEGYQYSWYCNQYNLFKGKLDLVMRQEHKLGEKCFVDYAGDTIDIVEPQTGEVQKAYLFVGVLGASNYTYCEASLSQNLPCWIGAHVHMFEYFEGCPEIVVPDNLKSGVTRPNLYEPDINPTYQEMAEHYNIAVIPARVRHPKDKAKVEGGVLLAERWILAALRNRTFYSLNELNIAIREKLEALNNRAFSKLPGSRKSLFEEEEKTVLQKLPRCRYQFANRKEARVHIDYHVELEGHFYSVPYTLVRQKVELRWTAATVEIFHHGKRVTSHIHSTKKGKATTLKEHMPVHHRKMTQWTPERFEAWASKTGPWTQKMISHMLCSRRHPEQAFRSCLGVMRLSDKVGAERLEAACHRAVNCGGHSYKTVKSILDHNLDQQKLKPTENLHSPSNETHENIRGETYFN